MENRKPRYRISHYIFFTLYFTVIPLKIAAMSVQDWYKQGQDVDPPKNNTYWEGSLFEIFSSKSVYIIGEKSYDELSDHYCKDSYNNSEWFDKAACETFTNLNGGGISFIAFSSLEILFIIAYLIFTALTTYQKSYLCLRVFFSIISTLCGFFGLVVMVGTAMVTYSNACHSVAGYYSTQSNTCAMTGPQLDLFNFLYILAISFGFWVFQCSTKCENKMADENKRASLMDNNRLSHDQGQIPTQPSPIKQLSPSTNPESPQDIHRFGQDEEPDMIYRDRSENGQIIV
ncbi:unnamed protein product [Blepharisma stoltei]|uniref:Uncharacterized protein n=1 Tax=Blepharisma stoltei TaxID=1481888 RepID=A0AAU9JI07_9CILI|nr:unnamed protein product [Blepharisma stoltei]